MEFNQALAATGYGVFHWKLMLCGCLCQLSAGCQYILNGFIMPSACDLQMSTQVMGLVNVLFLSGTVLSAYLFGVLADMFGRRKVILVALVLDATLSVVASLSQHVAMLLACRFLTGFIVGAPASLIGNYVAEFHVESRRAVSLSVLCFFWGLSWLSVSVLAMVIIPIQWSYESAYFKYNSWRMLVAVFAIPSTLSAILLSQLPESPGLLLSNGKSDAALRVLREMFAANTGRSRDVYPVTMMGLSSTREYDEHVKSSARPDEGGRTFRRLLVEMLLLVRSLFQPRYRIYTFIGTSLMCANLLGEYGMGLWIPDVITRRRELDLTQPNSNVSICELKQQQVLCSNSRVLEQTVFASNAIIGAANLMGSVVYGVVGHRFNNRVVIAAPMLLSASSALAIYFARSTTQIITVACFFEIGLDMSYVGICNVIIASFPTTIRSIALCTAFFAGRIGGLVVNLVFGALLDSKCQVPFFLVAGILAGAAVIAMCAPLHHSKTPETKPDPLELQQKYSKFPGF